MSDKSRGHSSGNFRGDRSPVERLLDIPDRWASRLPKASQVVPLALIRYLKQIARDRHQRSRR